VAERLAARLDRPWNPVLKIRRKVSKQGTLSIRARFRNVRGIFRVSAGYDLAGARVMLIDDVMTTGATASEASRQLRRAGADSVIVTVVARGVGHS